MVLWYLCVTVILFDGLVWVLLVNVWLLLVHIILDMIMERCTKFEYQFLNN